MDLMLKLSSGLSYLWMIFSIMIIAGLARQHDLFASFYGLIRDRFGSNRLVVVLLSAVGGVLPIEGRVTVSAGLLDTVAPRCGHGRQKMGIVDYLATHHYYLWSPLEKTVILPMAALGLSYGAWLSTIAPLLIVSLLFIGAYIWYAIGDEDVEIASRPFSAEDMITNVLPLPLAIGAYIYDESLMLLCFGGLAAYYVLLTRQWDPRRLLSHVNWEVLVTVAVVIVLGNWFKSQEAAFNGLLRDGGFDPHGPMGMLIISAIGFGASFLMGSSSKFIALAVLMSQAFGAEYFLWFFAIDYAGYLLSPTHKCVMVGNRYFGTPYATYYTALGAWALLLLITAGVFTWA